MAKNSSAEIVELFWSMSKMFKQHLDRTSPAFYLTIAQLESLRYVAEHKTLTMRELADCLDVTPPSATAMVDHLVKSNLLRRRHSPKDRRGVNLTLTAKGQTIYKKAMAERCRWFTNLIKNLNDKERAELVKILKKMSQVTV